MKCSIIMSVLDSHECFRRQIRRFNAIVPSDFEVIVLDDGSEVPLTCDGPVRFALRIVRTRDPRPWTAELARNRGAALASGEYLLMTDVDHILTSEIVNLVRGYRGDMLKFGRRVADLDDCGGVRDVRESLASPPNIFAVRKSLFLRLGGYGREYLGYGADIVFRSKYAAMVARGLARRPEVAGTIYVVTRPDWFHSLERKPAHGSSRSDVRRPARLESPRPPRALLGDWSSFRLEDWREAKDHKFLNRDANLDIHWQRLRDLLPEYATSDRRRRFLDVGCGNGATLEILRYLGHHAEGLDFTPGISNADPTDWLYRPLIDSQRLRCSVHDGASVPYPYPDRSFDVVICYGAINCFRPSRLWRSVLDEFARLARSCILLGVNLDILDNDGRQSLRRWRHPDFELVSHAGPVYKWRRKRTDAPRRVEDARTRRTLIFTESAVWPVLH